MKFIGKAFILGAAMAATSIIACSSNQSPNSTGSNTPVTQAPGSGGNTAEGTGTVGIQYTLSTGSTISTISYSLTNGVNTYTGTAPVGSGNVVNFTIGGVATGSGYSITINGSTTDGKDTCWGSLGAANPFSAGAVIGSTFAVAARTTTNVNVNLVCLDNQNIEAGSVGVTAELSCCATWDLAQASSSTANTTAPGGSGNTVSLQANASGPCGITGDAGANPLLNCTWTVTSGTGTVSATVGDGFGNFTSTFTCPSIGQADVITLSCTDGPLPDGGSCPSWSTTTTVAVTCGTAACSGPGTGVGVGVTSPGDTSGDAAVPFTATGACTSYGAGFINDGNGCCYAPCAASGNEPSTPFSATGSCAAFAGTSNNGAGCCQALHPCTVAGDTTCVKCQGNASGLCSPTEAVIVQRDITKGFATAAGPDTAAGCYTCLFGADCIDDTVSNDVNFECGDTLAGGTSAQCLATLSCIFQNACAGSAVATCYCGTTSIAACKNNPATVNGACDAQIAAGLGFAVTDGTDVSNNLTNATLASGKADQIFTCGFNAGCSQCLN